MYSEKYQIQFVTRRFVAKSLHLSLKKNWDILSVDFLYPSISLYEAQKLLKVGIYLFVQRHIKSYNANIYVPWNVLKY